MEIYYFLSNRYDHDPREHNRKENFPESLVLTNILIVKESSKVSEREKGDFPFGFMLKYIYLLLSTPRQR